MAIICVVLLLVCILLAFAVASTAGGVLGGAARRRTPPPDQHIVVDTLNLSHYLFTTQKKPVQMSTSVIVDTIAKTANILRKRFPGRVMYVTKDRESTLNDPSTRKAYAAAARDHSVYIEAVERYEQPPARAGRRSEAHSARGRDDFYLALLSKKYRCSVLTEDRFRDFDAFRSTVDPFHVYEYSYWKDIPDRDYIDPRSAAYRGLKRPHAIRYMEVLAELRPEARGP